MEKQHSLLSTEEKHLKEDIRLIKQEIRERGGQH